jgi:hypothetical protein
LVEIAPGVPELCWNIHTHKHTYILVYSYSVLAYFPSVARVFIYPNIIVICVPSLADNFYAPWRYIAH